MSSNYRSLVLAVAWLVSAQATAFSQILEVGGVVEKPVKLSMADLELLPHVSVQATDHDGVKATWSGPLLHQVLQQAGVPFGDQLRGKALSLYVLVTAADGYQVVLALPELDPRCTDDPVILALKKEDAALDAAQGPFRLVLPKERRPVRWVRQVVKLQVLRAGTAPADKE